MEWKQRDNSSRYINLTHLASKISKCVISLSIGLWSTFISPLINLRPSLLASWAKVRFRQSTSKGQGNPVKGRVSFALTLISIGKGHAG